MITASCMLEKVEKGLMDDVRWAKAHGFKRNTADTAQGDPQWVNGDVRLVLDSGLQWTMFTSFGSVEGSTLREVFVRCRDLLAEELKTISAMQELKEFVDRMLDEP